MHALVATGRWDEAAQVAHDLQQQWAAEGMALALHLQLAQVAAARGSGADFDRQMSIIDGFARPDDPYAVHDVTAAHAEHLLWQGGADRAHRITQESLDQLRGPAGRRAGRQHVQPGAARARRPGDLAG